MAEQITFLSLSNFTIGSTSDFHSNVCKLIDGATPAALHVEDLYPAYKTATGTLASVVNRPLGKPPYGFRLHRGVEESRPAARPGMWHDDQRGERLQEQPRDGQERGRRVSCPATCPVSGDRPPRVLEADG